MARRIQNIVVSVHQRLLNKARKSSRPFNGLLLHFAIERFIYRLSKKPSCGQFHSQGGFDALDMECSTVTCHSVLSLVCEGSR